MEKVVHKVKLGSGKEVLLHDVKIKHQELAMQAVGSRAKDSPILFAGMMQKELLKMLIFQVDGVEPKAAEREDLDQLFSMPDYKQLLVVVGKLMGGEDDMGEPQVEQVMSGSK